MKRQVHSIEKPETTESILELLLKVNKEFGITILLITHEMNVIQKICDYVYVIEDGELIEHGKTIDLFTNPQHETTNRFLNSVSERKLSSSVIEQLNVSGKVARLTFVGDAAGQPLLADATELFNVKPNILSANIIELKNGIVGVLVVHFDGEEQASEKAIQFLKDKDVVVEELGLEDE